MTTELQSETITETDRQLLLSGLVAAALNVKFMEGRGNIENAAKMIATASKRIKRMVRAVECGHPVEYVSRIKK